MKKITISIFALLAASVVLAGPISVALTYPSEVHEILLRDMWVWASKPPLQGANTCGTGVDCCPASTAASQAQCLALAKSFVSAPDFWTRAVYECIAADSDWACNTFGTGADRQMICETVPATDSVRLGDVARCSAINAVVSF